MSTHSKTKTSAPKLEQLLTRPDIWQASARIPRRRFSGDGTNKLGTGFTSLDALLHEGGWPQRALSEILSPGGAGLSLSLPLAARFSRAGYKVIFLNPPARPHAPTLAGHQLALEQVRIVHSGNAEQWLWAATQILRAGLRCALLAWAPPRLPHKGLRKLQLAAHNNDGLSVLLRDVKAASNASPAVLRIVLSPGPKSYHLQIIKQRGGPAGQTLELPRPQALIQAPLSATELPVYQPPPPVVPPAPGEMPGRQPPPDQPCRLH